MQPPSPWRKIIHWSKGCLLIEWYAPLFSSLPMPLIMSTCHDQASGNSDDQPSRYKRLQALKPGHLNQLKRLWSRQIRMTLLGSRRLKKSKTIVKIHWLSRPSKRIHRRFRIWWKSLPPSVWSILASVYLSPIVASMSLCTSLRLRQRSIYPAGTSLAEEF